MRLLVVSEHYAPTAHTEAFCTARFARALAAAGADVTVVTSGPGYVRETPQDPSPTWADEGGVDVVRLPTPWPRPWKALRTAWTRCVRPRRMKWWHDDARRRALALHAARPFDVVVTRHEPDRVAWIGHALASAGVPWIAFFPDPSPPCLHPPPYGTGAPRDARERADLEASQRWWDAATAFAWPCPRLARAHARALGREAAPRIVVPHVGGVAAARDRDGGPAIEGDARPGARPSDGLVLVHTGLWMKGRVSDAALAALRAAAAHAAGQGVPFHVDLVGPPKPADEARVRAAGLASVVRFRGWMPQDDALAALRDATAGLLLEAPMDEGGYLPSKFCDYARSGTPVLAFSPVEGTVADALGAGHPGLLGQTEASATAGLVAFVDRFAAEGAAGLASWRAPDPTAYAPEVVAAGFLRDVARVLGTPGPKASGPRVGGT